MEGVIEYLSDQLTIIMSLTQSLLLKRIPNNNSTNNHHNGYTISQGNDNLVSTQESFDAEVMVVYISRRNVLSSACSISKA
jgi:hypothetical protein